MTHDRKLDISEDREALRKLPTIEIVKLFLEKEEPVFDEKTKHLNSAAKQALSNEFIVRFDRALSSEDQKELTTLEKTLENKSPLTDREHVVIGYVSECITKNVAKAFSHYSQATKSPIGNFLVGLCHRSGIGTLKDEKKAVTYYEKAASLGNATAFNSLGYCYANGLGVSKDERRAVTYYEKAASLDNASAFNNLGYHYENGLGVSKDEKRAVTYYEQAASLGSVVAFRNLGSCYEHGKGVNKDFGKAIAYYYRALKLSDQERKDITEWALHYYSAIQDQVKDNNDYAIKLIAELISDKLKIPVSKLHGLTIAIQKSKTFDDLIKRFEKEFTPFADTTSDSKLFAVRNRQQHQPNASAANTPDHKSRKMKKD